MTLKLTRAHKVLGLTLVTALALFLAVLLPVWAKHNGYEAARGDAEPRVARLLGLAAAAPRLEARLQSARDEVGPLAYAADLDANRASTDLQQQVRRIAEQNGLNVTASQILPVRGVEEGVEAIGLSVTLQGALPGTQGFFRDIAREAPVLIVEQLTLQPMHAGKKDPTAQRLAMQVRLIALRRVS
ncbi:MAG: type II secretion system protein GspM [Halothiobacillaceae bacterium]|nr:type II secretion system protein GspM [Halothiobacillaceae bacterium]MDY0050231.1 type II secretion system protein GspM [Halothiobacillaceae bacterium]